VAKEKIADDPKMMARCKWLAERAATWIFWQLVARRSDIGDRPPVLCYHRVLPDYLEDENQIYSIFPQQFESQLAFLAGAEFHSLSLQEYAELARGRQPVEKRTVLITFDDGYGDNFAIAWPLARKYHMKINLFICTGAIGQESPMIMGSDGYGALEEVKLSDAHREKIRAHIRRFPQLWRPLTSKELREMQEAGVQIGFHSHRHRHLASLPPEVAATDLARGIDVFKMELGYRPRFFALPYGGYDSYTPAVTRLLRGFGFELIFSTHLGRACLPSDAQIFPRLCIHQRDSLATFKRKLAGAYDCWETARRLNHLRRQLSSKIRLLPALLWG
jgi:peptidoglycan/xylan/chitin deacetylase (PgdA/CDA1 family)